jgi:hypothetical protein
MSKDQSDMGSLTAVTIDLPPDIEADLAAQAAARGLPLAEHLRRLLAELAGRRRARATGPM